MIVTFYSFKGGVGRSMALVNVGEILADLGYRVILCDWDLEAPGLERYLLRETDLEGDLARFQSSTGLVDLLLEFKRALTGKGVPPEEAVEEAYKLLGKVRVRTPASAAVPIDSAKTRSGSLRLLTAGRRDGAFLDAYAEAVRGFDWGDFYDRWGGGTYIDFFRAELAGDFKTGTRGAADIVLIDSRTGVTEQGGVCTHHLADVVVLVTASNDLNFDGSLWMARMLKDSKLAELRGGRPLLLLPVASRIEQISQKEELVDFRHRFHERFSAYVPEAMTAPREYLLSSEIPYMPFYSYRERVVAREPEDRREIKLYNAYKALADAIVRCGIASSLLREPTPQGRVVDLSYSAGMPAWDEETFLAHLKEAIQTLDKGEVNRLCDELLEHFEVADQEVSDETILAVIRMLRSQQSFEAIRRLTEALILVGRKTFFVRKHHAVALLELGDLATALSALESLAQDSREDPRENAQARGQIGRVYRRLYLGAGSPSRGRRYLERGVNAYLQAYHLDSEKNLWQGIEAAALLRRGVLDGLQMEGFPAAEDLALAILETIDARRSSEALTPTDLAVAAQACIALDRSEEALAWIAEYVESPEVDVFDLQSSWNRLREAWDLTLEAPPGSLLLPVLQSNILSRGGRVDLTPSEIGPPQEEARTVLVRVLTQERSMTLAWYRRGLERCRQVAQVRTADGDGVATGLLIRGSDLDHAFGDEMLFLTCACAISDDSVIRRKYGALDPAEAVIVFEALEAPQVSEFRISRILWSSPPDDLDATLLTLDPPPAAGAPYPIAKNLPVADGQQKVYIIGHLRGGKPSFSMQDNLLLDHDNRVLHYRTPTEGGSSGSPVFDEQWKLIGLHHAGSQEMPRLNGQPGTYAANEGIQIQRIIEAVQEARISAQSSAPPLQSIFTTMINPWEATEAPLPPPGLATSRSAQAAAKSSGIIFALANATGQNAGYRIIGAGGPAPDGNKSAAAHILAHKGKKFVKVENRWHEVLAEGLLEHYTCITVKLRKRVFRVEFHRSGKLLSAYDLSVEAGAGAGAVQAGNLLILLREKGAKTEICVSRRKKA